MQMRLAEIRFDSRQTIGQVKELLERKFGTSAEAMTLELRDTADQTFCQLNDDALPLANYAPQENYTIHVTDTSGTVVKNEWDDVSKVEKYEISEQDYSKRDDTFRVFKDKMLKQNPNFMKPDGESIYEDF